MLLVITGTYLPPLVWLYAKHGDARGMRHEGFEAWCGERPIVVAMHCPRTPAADVAKELSWVSRRRWLNVRGGFPWGNYSIRLAAEALSEDVVGLRVVGAKLLRGPKNPDFVDTLTAELSQRSEEVWLHGELWSDDASPHPPEVSWRAGSDPRDGLRVRRATERPWWLIQATTKKPPRPDHRPREQAEAHDVATAS